MATAAKIKVGDKGINPTAFRMAIKGYGAFKGVCQGMGREIAIFGMPQPVAG